MKKTTAVVCAALCIAAGAGTASAQSTDVVPSDSLGTIGTSDSLGTGSLPGSSTGPAGSVTSALCGPLGGSLTGSTGLGAVTNLLCGPLGKVAGSLDDNLDLGSISGAVNS